MANNVTFLDFQDSQITFATTNTAGVQYPHNMSHLNVANADVTNSNPVPVVFQTGNNYGGTVGVLLSMPSSTFNRPNTNTAYSSGQLVANSTTNTSVVALSWAVARVAGGTLRVARAKIKKSSNVTTNATFRLHLYGATPTITNGDGGAWLTTESTYFGGMDCATMEAFSDSAVGIAVPNQGNAIGCALSSNTTLFGLIEARGAYIPANTEVFTVILEALPN